MAEAPLVPTSRLVREPLLDATNDDRYFDYCLEPYTPRRPWEGKLRSETLLRHALQVGGMRDALGPALDAVQASVGRDLTVWGVKWDGTRLWWELYFYDPQKEDVAATVSSVARTLAPHLLLVPSVRESVPYMMASFDLSSRTVETRRIDELNLYLTGEAHHAGRSYKLRDGGAVELENTYRFFRSKPEAREIVELLRSSVFVDYADPRTLSRVLVPELFACKKVCVAKKRTCDAVYYSGITVEQLLWFLRRFAYPAELVALVDAQQERLDHLYFDVGIDYRDDETGRVVFPKSSYYGTL